MRAMILAAGRGERMRPLTDTTPKPLLCVGGKPLIVWHIERLVAAGIRDIIVNHAWLGEQIESTLGDGEQFGARLRYSPETKALETAGGIAKALPFFQGQPFLVVNGDIWCDWTPTVVDNCVQALLDADALAWLLMVDNPPHNTEGDFLLAMPANNHTPDTVDGVAPVLKGTQAQQSVSPIRLRTEQNQHVPNAQALTFAGVGIYQPHFFSTVPSDTPAALAPLLRTAIEKNRVIGSPHTGEWVDVGTPERLQALDQRLAMQRQARYTSG